MIASFHRHNDTHRLIGSKPVILLVDVTDFNRFPVSGRTQFRSGEPLSIFLGRLSLLKLKLTRLSSTRRAGNANN